MVRGLEAETANGETAEEEIAGVLGEVRVTVREEDIIDVTPDPKPAGSEMPD